MTFEELDTYTGLIGNQKAIEEYISRLNESATESPLTGQLVKELRRKQYKDAAKQKQIEEWIQTVPDSEIKAIAHYRFIKRLSWEKICEKVYGWLDPYYARTVFTRYLKKCDRSQERQFQPF